MISVRVPATTANLGPGFDCLGMTLDIYNTFKVSEDTGGLVIETGYADEYIDKDEDNLVFRAIKRLYEEAGKKIPGLKIIEEISIPISRGLGSSASCIVGGLVAANEMLGRPFGNDKLLELATELEGHPDNVAPALLGGFVISSMDKTGVRYFRHDMGSNVKLLAMIPDFTLNTSKARSVLPDTVSLKDAVFNISRSCLLVSSLLTGDLKNISYAVDDRLHQPYRLGLIKDGEYVLNSAYKSGCRAVFISGSGPTLMALSDSFDAANEIEKHLTHLETKWKVKRVYADNTGACAVRC